MTKRICFVMPALPAGGAERVMSVLSNELVNEPGLEVHLVLFLYNKIDFMLDPGVKVHAVAFNYKKYSRLHFIFKSFLFLIQKFKEIKPDAALSFGGNYNAFVILAGMLSGTRVFISDRSRPGISHGFLADKLNRFLYRFSSGLIAQTAISANFYNTYIRQSKIRVIGNPVISIDASPKARCKTILNVGRFDHEKNQHLLIAYFDELDLDGWDLKLIGDGPKMHIAEAQYQRSLNKHAIHFVGYSMDVPDHYKASAIFAFTSTLEGFPNVLAEAMAAGCACISFDCETGPGELIEDGINGYLIPVGDHELYKQRLKALTENDAIRKMFSENAVRTMKEYSASKISRQYLNFMLGREHR